jgi:ATP-dependent RNA helicase DeaD
MEKKNLLALKENQVLQKKSDIKPSGFTNNPKYFGKKPSENTSSEDSEKKSFGFKGKKKFKSRNSRPKNFTFKKHSQKRASS